MPEVQVACNNIACRFNVNNDCTRSYVLIDATGKCAHVEQKKDGLEDEKEKV